MQQRLSTHKILAAYAKYVALASLRQDPESWRDSECLMLLVKLLQAVVFADLAIDNFPRLPSCPKSTLEPVASKLCPNLHTRPGRLRPLIHIRCSNLARKVSDGCRARGSRSSEVPSEDLSGTSVLTSETDSVPLIAEAVACATLHSYDRLRHIGGPLSYPQHCC